jgi:nitrogen fixation-related uncharacterized protein
MTLFAGAIIGMCAIAMLLLLYAILSANHYDDTEEQAEFMRQWAIENKDKIKQKKR